MQSRCSGIQYYYLPNGQLYIDGLGVYKHEHSMPEKVFRWRNLIYKKAIKYNIPPALIVAVMWQESGGNPNAGSYANAYGLMQLIQSTANNMAGRKLSKEEVFDPNTNVDLGSKLLSQLYDKYNGNLPHILASYNAGGAYCGTGKQYPSGNPCPANRYGLVQNCGYIDSVIKNYNRAIELGWDGQPVKPTSKIATAFAVLGVTISLAGITYIGTMYAKEKGFLDSI